MRNFTNECLRNGNYFQSNSKQYLLLISLLIKCLEREKKKWIRTKCWGERHDFIRVREKVRHKKKENKILLQFVEVVLFHTLYTQYRIHTCSNMQHVTEIFIVFYWEADSLLTFEVKK